MTDIFSDKWFISRMDRFLSFGFGSARKSVAETKTTYKLDARASASLISGNAFTCAASLYFIKGFSLARSSLLATIRLGGKNIRW